MAKDKMMTDLSQAASLVKSISIKNSFTFPTVLSNRYFLGTVQMDGAGTYVGKRIVRLYEKSSLFTSNPSPEATGVRQIQDLPLWMSSYKLSLNTTSIVCVRGEEDEQGQWKNFLVKKDFWMTRNMSVN